MCGCTYILLCQASSGSITTPDQLTGFQKHAIILILICVMNTLSQLMLCHCVATGRVRWGGVCRDQIQCLHIWIVTNKCY